MKVKVLGFMHLELPTILTAMALIGMILGSFRRLLCQVNSTVKPV